MDRVTALSMLLSRPLAVTAQALRVMLGVVSRDEFFGEERRQALEARNGVPLANTHGVEVRDGVAVIPVLGPLVRKASMFDEVSGATSYETLRKDIQAAIDDPKVGALLLTLNSPGGEVTGVAELADAIYSARGVKPIVAYVDGMACSAAYWIASACDEIVTAQTGELGSIGCMLAFVDDSAAMAQAGVKEIRFVSSVSPNKNPDPETDQGKAQYQALVDELAGVFVQAVARNRGRTVAQVLERFGQGAVMVGETAVKAGLADRAGNFEAVLAGLVSRLKERSMMGLATMLGLGDDATAEQVGEKVAALMKFEAQALAAAEAHSHDEAIGRIKAGVESLGELAKVRAERAAEQAKATQEQFRSVLAHAIDSKRLTLGQLAKVVPTFLEDGQDATAREAVEGIKEQTAEGVLAAVCSAQASPRALARVVAYLEAQAPAVVPEPVIEPATPEAPAGDDLDEKIAAIAKQARATLDANVKK